MSKSDLLEQTVKMRNRLLGYNFSLLHVDYVSLSNKWNYANVISPYFRIYYIDDGEGLISTKQEKIKLDPGHLYIVPSFTLCNLYCKSTMGQYFLHFFEDALEGMSLFENNRKVMKVPASATDVLHFKRLHKINPGRGINRSDNPKEYEKQAYYKSYQDLNNTVSEAVYFETQGLMLLLISRFLNSRQFKTMTPDPIPSKILEAMRYIQVNLREDLTVNHLANQANLHQDYFSRLFLKYVGQRPLSYVHDKRIERAQYLIAATPLSFGEIAEKVGFEDLSHFAKIFKKVTSVTPGDYKKQNRLH